MQENILSNYLINKKIVKYSSFKILRFKKIKLTSINKTIIIPTLNSKSTISTEYKSKISTGNIISKKFNSKINKFKISDNENYFGQIQSYRNRDRNRIKLNLINIKSRNILFNNIRKFNPLSNYNSPNNNKSISFVFDNSYSKDKIKNKHIFSSVKSFSDNSTYISKKQNNPINNMVNISSIKIGKIDGTNRELKPIYKINNTIKSKISIKKKSMNTITLKSNIYSKDNKVNIKEKNQKFLKFINDKNCKDKIGEIDNVKNNITKNKVELSKMINSTNEKAVNNKQNNNKIINLNYIKRNIFIKNNNSVEIYLNNNNFINIRKLKCQINIYENIINFFSIKYNIQNNLISFLGISSTKKKSSISSQTNEILINHYLLKSNSENEINSQIIQKKDIDNKNNIIKKFSIIEEKKPKRNTQTNSKKYWMRFSLLNNEQFFINKNKSKNNKNINPNCKRKSFFQRSIFTILNRRKSKQIKKILKKEDFLMLKSLIDNRKENQFEFELQKFINNYDINSSDKNGNTLLTYACMNGEINIVKYLLKNDANPNCINNYRNTPLHYALSNKYYDIADLLIQNKAKDNIKNIYGLTPWKNDNNFD